MALLLKMVIAANGFSHPVMPGGYSVNGKLNCMEMCYYNESCTSLFFDTSSKTCYPSEQRYAPIDLIKPTANVMYFVSDVCSEGYTMDRVLKLCYKLFIQKSNWQTAKKTCFRDGGHLAKIETGPVNSLLHSLSKQNGVSLWIGAKADDKNNFLWEDGSPIAVDFWAGSEPCKLCGGCIAMQVNAGTADQSWFDTGCDNGMSFACQKDVRDSVNC